jgi:hypothetical protein
MWEYDMNNGQARSLLSQGWVQKVIHDGKTQGRLTYEVGCWIHRRMDIDYRPEPMELNITFSWLKNLPDEFLQGLVEDRSPEMIRDFIGYVVQKGGSNVSVNIRSD